MVERLITVVQSTLRGEKNQSGRSESFHMQSHGPHVTAESRDDVQTLCHLLYPLYLLHIVLSTIRATNSPDIHVYLAT